MPLFHFNSHTGGVVLPDLDEEELPNVAVARVVAEESARETLIEALKSGDAVPDCIQVTDQEGNEVASISLDGLLRS